MVQSTLRLQNALSIFGVEDKFLTFGRFTIIKFLTNRYFIEITHIVLAFTTPRIENNSQYSTYEYLKYSYRVVTEVIL